MSISENIIRDLDLTKPMYNIYQSTYTNILMRVENKIRSSQNIIRSNLNRLEISNKEINNYWVEIHKKYSIPAVCIIFVIIGASLGTMTRKGGFGMAAGISMLFFVVYWAFLIGGEKTADRGLLSPFWGMWSANILLGVLGIFLVIKTSKERVNLNFDFLNKILPKQFRIKQETNADS
jgi:lipopolysaccharide export system permease protein